MNSILFAFKKMNLYFKLIQFQDQNNKILIELFIINIRFFYQSTVLLPEKEKSEHQHVYHQPSNIYG